MINNWWVTRPKRRLDSIPEILATFSEVAMGQRWEKDREIHRVFEDALEKNGIKKKGQRREGSGSGGRTYMTWLSSLGLIFCHESNKFMYLTLAGEAIMDGDSLASVMLGQLLRFQYPSPFSLNQNIDLHPRFKIRPFRFLFRLLADPQLQYLTEKEIGLIVIVEAENESDSCYMKVRDHILEYRKTGLKTILPESEFFQTYSHSKPREKAPFAYFTDIANTFVNYLEITQLIRRVPSVDGDTRIMIAPEKHDYVQQLMKDTPAFIGHPEAQEFFQRKFGIDPKHQKDTRDLDRNSVVTYKQVQEEKIRRDFIAISVKKPIYMIDDSLIEQIASETTTSYGMVSDVLHRSYPQGSINGFLSSYFQMAFSGREEAIDFEEATANIFHDILHFEVDHIGQQGRVPDVVIYSPEGNWQAIIDNKAYAAYTVNHDHENRMVHTYIPNIAKYSKFGDVPLAFFCYIAGGFGKNIESNLLNMSQLTGIPGTAISVSTVIDLINLLQKQGGRISHALIFELFTQHTYVSFKEIEKRICY